jgi:hypothetical protein
MRPALLILLLSVLPAAAETLAGTWLKDGRPYAELRADGTGAVEGDPLTWKADAKTVSITDDDGMTAKLPYTLKDGVLTIPVDGVPTKLTRGGKAKPAAKTAAGKDELSALLLSSPWCFFSYSQVSGTTKQERVVFAADGTWGSGSRRESHSSGMYGTVSGRSDGQDGGRWVVKGARLLMGEGAAAPEDVGLSVSRNSNGYPILKADGKEYSQCR